MADETPSIDPYKLLHVIYNPEDDTLARLFQIPCINTTDISAKDVPLNPSNKTSMRLFRPTETPLNEKLPIILYFHGGGFILCNAANTVFNNFCAGMANNFPAIIVSVSYRLAPENRLPAAYEDAMDAINWVQKQGLEESWLKEMADFSKCYLMGCSSGGNIVYHAGLRALSLNLSPLKIKGLILNQPFFGGIMRTGSDLRLMNDKTLPLAVSDLMWELALPKGSGRDHWYCNPMINDGGFGEKIRLLGRCFVSVRGGDILMDHQMKFVEMLEKNGVEVMRWFEDAGYHGMELFEEPKAQALFVALREFICSKDTV